MEKHFAACLSGALLLGVLPETPVEDGLVAFISHLGDFKLNVSRGELEQCPMGFDAGLEDYREATIPQSPTKIRIQRRSGA